MAGILMTVITLLFVVFGMIATPYDPEAMDASAKLAGISWKHLMGCDNFGRDVLSRVMKGSATTLLIAMGTVMIGMLFGILIGAVAGYYGGLADEILMRLNDAALAFPSILLALVLISLFGTGKYNIILALGIAFVPSFARIVRSEFIRQHEMDYIRQAKLIGVSDRRIMFVHILPNSMRVLVSSLLIGFNNAVLAEAGLSFLGIGVQPPDASLGRMLSEAQAYLFSRPGYALCVGGTLIFIVLGFSFLGEGIGNESR
ncbi:MAG: ABC transporter permease [Lachnospiraceae bacterium]|nr:ABC transporter permease [Lachnospiraceae bacterium]